MQTNTLKEENEPKAFTQSAKQNISVFGLGKVGLTLASCLSNAGNRVVGVDVFANIIDAVNNRSIKSNEPGVMERLHASYDSLSATISPVEAVEQSDLCFIIVPTPSNTFGAFSLRYVLNICEAIARSIKDLKKENYTISLVSTIFPGSSDHLIIPKLEQLSGRKIGEGLGYCYNPSFIALGEIVKGMEAPDYVLIGESDSQAGDIVLKAHQSMLAKPVPISRMLPIEAEITKLASNTHETMRVSFANMLLSLCAEIPGANVDYITGALAHRMGSRFFKGAVPFGGPCWPRDNKALSLLLELVGVPSRMPRNVDIFNEEHGRYIFRKILEMSKSHESVGIMGLAYKPGTHFIEKSYSIDLINWLLMERFKVVGWDPLAMDEVKQVIGNKITYATDGNICLELAEIIVIAQPIKELKTLDWSKCQEKIVIDCWRCLTPEQLAKIGHYIPLGGPNLNQPNWNETQLKNKIELLTN